MSTCFWWLKESPKDRENNKAGGVGQEKTIHHNWLVVSTPLKNISQLGWLFPIYGQIKNGPNHQPVFHVNMHILGSTRLLFTKPYIPNHTAILLTYENSLKMCATWSNWVKLSATLKSPGHGFPPISSIQNQRSNIYKKVTPLKDRTVFPGWLSSIYIFSNIIWLWLT